MATPRSAHIFLALLLFALLVTSASAVRADTIELTTPEGSRQIQAYDENKITYFSFSEFVEALGGALDWTMVGHKIVYIDEGNRLEFVIGSPFFKINDNIHNLTYPAVFKEGLLYLPAETATSFLNGVLPGQLTWRKESRNLRLESEFYNVNDLLVTRKANGLLVEIFLTRSLPYEVFVTEGNWLNVSITHGRVNSSQIGSRKDSRYMYKLSSHQAEGSGQVSIRLRRNVDKIHHKFVSNPPRIQISIADKQVEIEPVDTAPVVGPDDKIDVIVIDAGHGGKDYGAIGPGKTREKDVVLGIAKELAKLIRKDKQFKVVMTRDRDKFVSLEKRAKVANNAKADLFISIHANSSTKRRVRGWNVFFLAPARNDSARAVAQFENSVFLREAALQDSMTEELDPSEDDLGTDPVLSILNEMIMTEFQTESHDFAMMAAREFRRSLKIPVRGVDQAAFFVLNKVFTPSVLIESGFISNKTEEKLLKSSKYQKKVAKALYAAIKKFKAQYEKQ